MPCLNVDLLQKNTLFCVKVYFTETTTTKVEVCAGDGNLSRAFRDNGYSTKAFDVSWDASGSLRLEYYDVWKCLKVFLNATCMVS